MAAAKQIHRRKGLRTNAVEDGFIKAIKVKGLGIRDLELGGWCWKPGGYYIARTPGLISFLNLMAVRY
jgi:hypothetical protein